MRIFRLLILTAILVLIASPLDLAYSAPGSTFTATSVLDTVDVNPGNGECADAGGNCTLRAAVMEANASAGSDTVILLADTYALTIAGVGEDDAATGDLDLKGDLTISGADPENTIIDAEQSGDRIIHIFSGANVTISGVTIRNSNTSDNITGVPGGGLYNEGTLSITDSIISRNYGVYGAGILNGGSGKITITDSIISENGAEFGGAGIYNSDTGDISIKNSTISDNGAGSVGGGIYNGANLTITDSVVSSNYALSPGGGIRNDGEITIINSTVSNNEARFESTWWWDFKF